MEDWSRSLPRPLARPVADAPIEPLLARGGELARAWASRLVADSEPGLIASVPLQRIADGGPALCTAMLRAVRSDADLALLASPGATQAAEAIPPGDAPAAALAVESLRSVLWNELRAEMPPGAPAQLAGEIGDRLACVALRTLAAALGQEPTATVREEPRGSAIRPPAAASAETVIVDESTGEILGRACAPAPSQITIRDERAGHGPARGPAGAGPAAWIWSIGTRLERFKGDGLPFAVVLVELMDLQLLRAAEEPRGMDRLVELVEETLEEQIFALKPRAGEATAAALTREAPGRWWLLVDEGDRERVHALVDLLASSVGRVRDGRGEPVEIAAGISICPADGREQSELAAHSDVGLYAARAAARAALRRRAVSSPDPS